MSNWARLQAIIKKAPSPVPHDRKQQQGKPNKRLRAPDQGNIAAGGVPPPLYRAPADSPALLEPGMPHFEELMCRSFKGFIKQPPASLPTGLDKQVIQALESLKEKGFFHHDVVTNGGIRLGATVVRRILVGEPGITYKYLGLRTFAHPWSGEGARNELGAVLQLNKLMIASTRQLLSEGHSLGHAGSCAYNLSLINLLEPHDARGGPLRNRAGDKLGTGSMAVSWHADSSVQAASSIAVVNLQLPYHAGGRRLGSASQQPLPWRIAMKCVGEGHEPERPGGSAGGGGGGPSRLGTPAVAVPLAPSETYFLLGEFNDHHHHAVLAGDAPRYSSTHRVAVVASDTWQYISARCADALRTAAAGTPPSFARGDVLLAPQLRLTEEVHSEVELEWLRPWGIQGRTHAETHAGYWQPRMEQLERIWLQLEARTAAHLSFLVSASAAQPLQAAKQLPEGVRCFDVLLGLLTKREGVATDTKQQGRAGWRARAASKEYRQLPPDAQPFRFPNFPAPGTQLARVNDSFASDVSLASLVMPEESLTASIATLTRARAAFVKAASAGVSPSAATQPSGSFVKSGKPPKKKQRVK